MRPAWVNGGVADKALLDLILQEQTRPVKVTQNGVMWNGFRYGKREPALKRLLGQKVTLRADPADVTRLTAWTLDGKFICVAPSNKRLPKNATKEAVEEAMREKNHDRKGAAHLQESPRADAGESDGQGDATDG